MASWMVHLRVADKLMGKIRFVSPTEFIVGNIAPDSGVPNADWSVFTPSTTVSHFKTEKGQKAGPDAFAQKYFLPYMQERYDAKAYSFYLGYLVHLLTDVEWSKNVVHPALEKFSEECAADRNGLIWKMKEDWYDLDFRFLRDHPDFRAFRIYAEAEGFQNEFMEEFCPDAFDNRRGYITGFYGQQKENLDREYPYLSEAEMDAFVDLCWQNILSVLKSSYGLSCCW